MPDIGALEWLDLTVDDADDIRDFYTDVVGWKVEPVSMGDYSDYTMMTSGGNAIAGVCHARGSNADLPAVWLPYFRVASLEDSLQRCLVRGGTVVTGPKSLGPSMRYAVIRDSANVIAALFEGTENT